MDWGDFITDMSAAVIVACLPVAIGMALAWVRPVLKNLADKIALQVGDEEWRLISSVVDQFVQAAEQRGVWDDLLKEGERKKEWVASGIETYMKARGLEIDMDEIEAAIEAAVKQVKEGENFYVVNSGK